MLCPGHLAKTNFTQISSMQNMVYLVRLTVKKVWNLKTGEQPQD
jgi:hypothetical protein